MAAAAGGGSGGAAAGSPAGQEGRAGAQGRPAETEEGSAAAALPGFDSVDAFVKVRSDGAWGSGRGGRRALPLPACRAPRGACWEL